MTKYAALLRGINVGGNNIIVMADLKACFEKQGFQNVQTYIQSGNVIFTSPQTSPTKLASHIEQSLSSTFGYKSMVVTCSLRQLQQVVAQAPSGFGENPAAYRYDVIFLKKPLAAAEALPQLQPKEGVDSVTPGPGVLYFSRLIAKATQSRLPRLVNLPIYPSTTVRNWNTTTKLLRLMKVAA